MKPTGSNEVPPSKNSTNKSSKKVRTKLTKYVKQQKISDNFQDGAQDLYTGIVFHEKTYQRTYPGFTTKSLKVFWEQYDTSDMEVMQEVYCQLAEDITYQLCNVVNVMKTYSRHSGGRITCDIVNEVLKDSDFPIIIGLPEKSWDKVEYDENIFYKSDAFVDLREKYQEETTGAEIKHTGSIKITSSCSLQNSNILVDLTSNISKAIFLGDDESYKYALKLIATMPYISCLFKVLLKKCAEILIYQQERIIIERCMRFLCALTINCNTHDIECCEQFSVLANIFASLISCSSGEQAVGKAFHIKEKILDSVKLVDLNTCNTNSFEGDLLKTNSKMCISDESLNDLILTTLGHLSSQYGTFQRECRLLFLKRLEDCLTNCKASSYQLGTCFLPWIIRSLLILGENVMRTAMGILRENCLQSLLEDSSNYFRINLTIQNEEETLLYEWLNAKCGQIMQPLMLYARGACEKFALKRKRLTRPILFKILPKINLKCLTATTKLGAVANYATNRILSGRKRINFRVSGCRSVQVKREENEEQIKFQLAPAAKITRNIVVGKRKLLKPLSNRKTNVPLINLCFTQI